MSMSRTKRRTFGAGAIAALLGLAGFIAPMATASATPGGGSTVDQTCDDVVTPGQNGWTEKFDAGYPDTVEYTAPEGYLVDAYCVKAGSTQQGNGPIVVPVNPPAESVVIDYPYKDSISHYVVHLVPVPEEPPTEVTPVAPVYTPPTCDAPGSFVGTDTSQYTWVRSGPDSAAVLTAQPVGDVVLTGQTVYGPHDLTQLSGDECYTPPDYVNVTPGVQYCTEEGYVGYEWPEDTEFISYGGSDEFVLVAEPLNGAVINPDTLPDGWVLGEDGFARFEIPQGVECGDNEPYTETRTRTEHTVTCDAYTEITIDEARDWTIVEGDMLVPGDWYEVSRASSTRTPTADELKAAGLTCTVTPTPTPTPTTTPTPTPKPTPSVGPKVVTDYVSGGSSAIGSGLWFAASGALVLAGLALMGGSAPVSRAKKH